MIEAWIYSIVSVILVSIVSIIGIFLFAFTQKKLNSILIYMISFSAGALMGDAFIHLLPEVVKDHGFTVPISLYVLSGIALSFIIEKIIQWRHCHHPTTEAHVHPFALMNLFGDGVHNFIDGLIIGASYLASIPVGIATTLAVLFHEIPQEIGDFGVLVYGGFSKSKAILVNFIIALTSVLGAIVALLIGSYVSNITIFLIPFAAGSFIYIAGSDLIPELHKQVKCGTATIELVFFLLGICIMLLLLFIS
ncbi:MAG: ZIP family metal transporter [Candidatus Woesearchaeota archaeon]